jgi:capsular polysaccharide biosynthesis protein
MMQYIDEIQQIVKTYTKIRKSLNSLEEQARSLNLRKNQIEFELSQTREIEKSLIDKIKAETGETPDFYKILQDITPDA